MDCKTARGVWNHPEGFIAGLRTYLPGVIEALERMAIAFKAGQSNNYNDAVQTEANIGGFYSEHGPDDDPISSGIHDVVGDHVGRMKVEEHLSTLIGQPIKVATLCCSHAMIYPEQLDWTPGEWEILQMAAVNAEPQAAH
jgi:hypothetical protein